MTGLTSNPKNIKYKRCGKETLVTIDKNGFIDSPGKYFGQKFPPECCGEPIKEGIPYTDDKSS